jgi:hypothetical protein
MYVCRLPKFSSSITKIITPRLQRDTKTITTSSSQSSYQYHRINKSNTSFYNNKLINNMQTQAIMGRGGYNRISSPALGRGGYNRDVKSSGISRPSNPSSLTVRSARAADDGRGGYN